MPPRIHLRPRAIHVRILNPSYTRQTCAFASLATATTPAPPIEQTVRAVPPVLRYPPTQPPSHKPADVRKTQLHRQYQSLLKSSPLLLIFQHNSVTAVEWMSIRRELKSALQKVDAERQKNGLEGPGIAQDIRLQVIQTGIFKSALRVVEFFNPEEDTIGHAQHPTDPATPTSAKVPQTINSPHDPRFTHGLSRRAWEVSSKKNLKLQLEPILSGPLLVCSFPSVSPQHLKTVLSILSPSTDFPAPKRRTNPDYYEPAVQNGIQKLMLLGARVEGKVFDVEGTKWVGGIEGGIDGLRAQLVAILQGVGGGVTRALEGAGRSLYFTVEARKLDMEEKEKGD